MPRAKKQTLLAGTTFLIFIPLLFLSGCSTVSAPTIAARTGIPEQSIRVTAHCSYAATDIGNASGNASGGVFVLTEDTIGLYNDLNSLTPVYRLNFSELDHVAIASYRLNHQLLFYKGGRVLAVKLWNKYLLADKKLELQVYDYMKSHGVAKYPNPQLVHLRVPAPAY